MYADAVPPEDRPRACTHDALAAESPLPAASCRSRSPEFFARSNLLLSTSFLLYAISRVPVQTLGGIPRVQRYLTLLDLCRPSHHSNSRKASFPLNQIGQETEFTRLKPKHDQSRIQDSQGPRSRCLRRAHRVAPLLRHAEPPRS